MNGSILDFLRLAGRKPDLARELAALAARHDFRFTDEMSDEDLDQVAGGVLLQPSGLDTTAPMRTLTDTPSDPVDGSLGDCYLLSQLAQLQGPPPSS